MKVLFICTHNRCRSILCEAISNQLGQGRIQARSAGSQPAGVVHPLSLQYLEETGYSTEGLQSQSWDEFENFDADLVVTVCDQAAGESCPVWFGKSLKMHWGLEDPSKIQGEPEQQAQAFRQTIQLIEQRVRALLALPLESISREQLQTELETLGARSN